MFRSRTALTEKTKKQERYIAIVMYSTTNINKMTYGFKYI